MKPSRVVASEAPSRSKNSVFAFVTSWSMSTRAGEPGQNDATRHRIRRAAASHRLFARSSSSDQRGPAMTLSTARSTVTWCRRSGAISRRASASSRFGSMMRAAPRRSRGVLVAAEKRA